MRSRARGYGSDLAGARPYRPGDDVRRIDWRASARLSSARGSDDFVLREHLTEEATRVIVAVDCSPTMGLYPPGLPWLRKPAAVAEASAMILESALQAGCAIGELDNGSDSPTALLADVAAEARALPPGTFVFLLSDYLDLPADEVWQDVLSNSLDLIPVVIQDPVWEQSFPDVAGALLPLAEPATGRISHVRLSRKDVAARREENGARLRRTLELFDALGLDCALVSSHDPGRVLESFVAWAMARHRGARLV
jgi:uncharacterized protein (DUF58 family)